MAPDWAVWLILVHVAVSLLASLGSVALMPRQYRSSPRRVLAYHLVLASFLPVLGSALVLVLAFYARAIDRRPTERSFRILRLPVFTAATRDPVLSYGAGSIRSRLTNLELPKEVRLKALLTVQTMPGNLSTGLLREVLSDPSDDLRLTAYGMLDKGEKLLNHVIQQNLKLLESSTDANRQAQVHKQLAACYWELVYQGFAQGELRDFSLNAALRHARTAAQRRGGDADLWVLVGRIALERRDLALAAEALETAQKRSASASRVCLYLAELAFLKRDFATVRRLIHGITRQECGLSTAPLQVFWRVEKRA
jgi:polysaccharide biosynthesis protein PelE